MCSGVVHTIAHYISAHVCSFPGPHINSWRRCTSTRRQARAAVSSSPPPPSHPPISLAMRPSPHPPSVAMAAAAAAMRLGSPIQTKPSPIRVAPSESFLSADRAPPSGSASSSAVPSESAALRPPEERRQGRAAEGGRFQRAARQPVPASCSSLPGQMGAGKL